MSLLRVQQMMIAEAAAPAAPTTWNPSDCATGLALSNGNLTVAPSGAGSAGLLVRSTTSYATGKVYFEIHMDTTGASNFANVGVAPGGTGLNQSVNAAGGWDYYEQTGQKGHGGTNFTFGAAYVSGDVIGVALDLAAGKIWFAKNNTWQASGAPATGTNPAFTGLSGTLFAAVSSFASNGPTMTARFRTADFSFTPPAGFSAWGA